MSIMYRVDYGKPVPTAVECEMPEYPNPDADGNTIYENTHFGWEEDAWERLEAEQTAGVSLETQSVIRLREQLAQAEKKLVNEIIVLEQIRENRKEKGM